MSSRAVEMLMEEHRLIEQDLDSLASLADALERGEPVQRETVKRYAEFFREFADRCHHAKEEDRLFVKMQQYGIPKSKGPLAVMLQEHEAGRAHVRALSRLGEQSGPLSQEERQAAASQARAYRDLLDNHILKEDRILYPMGERVIPGPELEALFEAFEGFEEEVTGTGAHEKWQALARELIKAHPRRPKDLQGKG